LAGTLPAERSTHINKTFTRAIGGWLIVFIIDLFLGYLPIFNTFSFIETLKLSHLIPSSDIGSATAVLLFEGAALTACIILFFVKSRHLRMAYIILGVLDAAVIFVVGGLSSMVDIPLALISSLVLRVVWIFYLFVSQRAAVYLGKPPVKPASARPQSMAPPTPPAAPAAPEPTVPWGAAPDASSAQPSASRATFGFLENWHKPKDAHGRLLPDGAPPEATLQEKFSRLKTLSIILGSLLAVTVLVGAGFLIHGSQSSPEPPVEDANAIAAVSPAPTVQAAPSPTAPPSPSPNFIATADNKFYLRDADVIAYAPYGWNTITKDTPDSVLEKYGYDADATKNYMEENDIYLEAFNPLNDDALFISPCQDSYMKNVPFSERGDLIEASMQAEADYRNGPQELENFTTSYKRLGDFFCLQAISRDSTMVFYDIGRDGLLLQICHLKYQGSLTEEDLQTVESVILLIDTP